MTASCSSKVLEFTNELVLKSANGASAGRSTLMSVRKRDVIRNPTPALNNGSVIPADKPLTVAMDILKPPSHVPASVKDGEPPNLPVPSSSPCWYESSIPRLEQSL